MFKPLPPVLNGKPVRFKYTSLIAKAQKLNEGNAILRFFEASAPLEAIDPGVLHRKIDAEKALDELSDTFGAPQTIFRPSGDVEGIKDAQAKAQQEAIDRERQNAQTEQVKNISSAVNQ